VVGEVQSSTDLEKGVVGVVKVEVNKKAGPLSDHPLFPVITHMHSHNLPRTEQFVLLGEVLHAHPLGGRQRREADPLQCGQPLEIAWFDVDDANLVHE